MYYIVFLIGVILFVIEDKKKISFKIYTFILALLAFLRYGVGADYFAYHYLYNRLKVSLINEIRFGVDKQEILFRLLSAFIKKLGVPYEGYVIIIAAINLYFITKICKKYSKSPTMSLVIYFCFYYFVWTFSALRQGLVLSIGIYYFLECTKDKKNVKFIFTALILSLIHLSSIILIPLYFCVKLKFNRKKLITLFIFSIIVALIPIGKILSVFSWLPVASRLEPYLRATGNITNILNFQSMGRLVFIIIGFLAYNDYSKKDEISRNVINMYIISLCLYFIFKFSELTAARLSIYGTFLNIIVLPNIYFLYKEKINEYILITLILFMCAGYLYKELNALEYQSGIVNKNPIITPYTNVLYKKKYEFNNKFYYRIHAPRPMPPELLKS